LSDNKIYGLILVRAGSKRLPNKCFLDFGKISMIEHIITRCKKFRITPIVCTSDKKENIKIIKIAKKTKTKYFVGSNHNKIKRMSDCVKKFKIKYFHTIDADDPFFCGNQVKRSIKILLKGYDIVFPSKNSSLGGASVGFSINSDFLNKLNLKLKLNQKTEMMWKFFGLIKDRNTTTLPNQDYDMRNTRLTLDYYEDYIFLCILRKYLGNFASRKKIFLFLKKNKILKSINFFRNKDWQRKQTIQ
jgi:spore coat polysaccharide biosynthesis protein SpsF (cytidylyltransferase family)